MRKERNLTGERNGLGEILISREIRTREDLEETIHEARHSDWWRKLKKAGHQMVPLLHGKGVRIVVIGAGLAATAVGMAAVYKRHKDGLPHRRK